jgi:CRISPR-associated protein Cmr2
MGAYLIELSFGPVQSFIASARRSRDLWAGSHMLSEIARAAGSALIEQGAELIYPAQGRVAKENDDENSNLSNVLLARLPDADEAKAKKVAENAIAEARKRLEEFSELAKTDWAKLEGIRNELWDLQVADALEAYAAWAELGDDYKSVYKRLKSAFAARKNTRSFGPLNPPNAPWAEVPKNSFDGLRESVLPEKRKKFPASFGMSPGEQLDALGAIKRVVGKQERFTALTRLAAHGWLMVLDKAALQILRDAYEPLVKLELASRAKGNQGAYENFPYDAALLYPERLELEKKAAAGEVEALAALEKLESILKPLWKKHGQPCPYAVLVVADGDRMGVFVDAAKSADDHQAITRAVAGFADRVPAVAREHGGHCVFNGGEDLTVMFPLSGAVSGARALAEAFDASMKEVAQRLLGEKYQNERPTLRVGAAICHVLEPLGVIRQWGDEAEKFAKGRVGTASQGNALGLVLHVRAGHEIGVRLGFDDQPGFDALERWRGAYAKGEFPGRLAYDCRAIAMSMKANGMPVGVAVAEFRRLLDRARASGGEKEITPEQRQALEERRVKLMDAVDDPTGLKTLADELILARWLSAKSSRDISSLEGCGE